MSYGMRRRRSTALVAAKAPKTAAKNKNYTFVCAGQEYQITTRQIEFAYYDLHQRIGNTNLHICSFSGTYLCLYVASFMY